MAGGQPSVVFREELPLPLSNVEIYEQIYLVEQWLRRLAYASLMARFGSAWGGALPAELGSELKKRLKQLEGRVHLHCETSGNAIWLLTLEELRALLVMPSLWPTVKDLAGLPQRVIESRLDELREIRNVVGHNRATTPDTTVVVRGVTTALRPAIERFKARLLYDPAEIHLGGDEPPVALVPRLYEKRTRGNDWSRFQPMLSEGRYFYSLTRLPSDPGGFVRLHQALEALRPVETQVLALLVNKSGDEFTVAWPKQLSHGQHQGVVTFFFETAQEVWTETDYARQRASAVCDPRVWFYENRMPVPE